MSNCPKNVVVKRPSVSFSSICELILLLYWATRCHKQNLVTPTRKSIIEFLFGIGLSIDLCLFPFQIIKARPQIPPSSMATLLATFGISITFQRSPKPLEWGRVGTSLDIGCGPLSALHRRWSEKRHVRLFGGSTNTTNELEFWMHAGFGAYSPVKSRE